MKYKLETTDKGFEVVESTDGTDGYTEHEAFTRAMKCNLVLFKRLQRLLLYQRDRLLLIADEIENPDIAIADLVTTDLKSKICGA